MIQNDDLESYSREPFVRHRNCKRLLKGFAIDDVEVYLIQASCQCAFPLVNGTTAAYPAAVLDLARCTDGFSGVYGIGPLAATSCSMMFAS